MTIVISGHVSNKKPDRFIANDDFVLIIILGGFVGGQAVLTEFTIAVALN